jgi:hypothetical protein
VRCASTREYFSPDTRTELKLSPVDIILCGNDAGVASYTFPFQTTGRDVGGKRMAEKLETVRAKQVVLPHFFHERELAEEDKSCLAARIQTLPKLQSAFPCGRLLQ